MYMNKYNNSSIYAILDKITKKIYIGHTIQPLNVRFSNIRMMLNGDLKKEVKDVVVHLIMLLKIIIVIFS